MEREFLLAADYKSTLSTTPRLSSSHMTMSRTNLILFQFPLITRSLLVLTIYSGNNEFCLISQMLYYASSQSLEISRLDLTDTCHNIQQQVVDKTKAHYESSCSNQNEALDKCFDRRLLVAARRSSW